MRRKLTQTALGKRLQDRRQRRHGTSAKPIFALDTAQFRRDKSKRSASDRYERALQNGKYTRWRL